VLTVVTGPPCSGKSTYIRDHAGTGDLIIDLDRIARALTTDDIPGWDYPDHVRDVALSVRRRAVKQARTRWRHIPLWLIDTMPDRTDLLEYRAVGATIIALDPGETVCLDRARRERPPEILDLVRAWYATMRTGPPARGVDWTVTRPRP
jgi:predicted kinase